MMIPWSKDELRRIAEADDLHISPLREDSVTYGTPTWIWSALVDDALYVRGYNGQKSRWSQAAVRKDHKDHKGNPVVRLQDEARQSYTEDLKVRGHYRPRLNP